MTLELLKFLTKETNDYAAYCEATNKPRCKSARWKQITLEDIANFFGLRVLMGVLRLPTQRMFWSNDEHVGQPIFKKNYATQQI